MPTTSLKPDNKPRAYDLNKENLKIYKCWLANRQQLSTLSLFSTNHIEILHSLHKTCTLRATTNRNHCVESNLLLCPPHHILDRFHYILFLVHHDFLSVQCCWFFLVCACHRDQFSFSALYSWLQKY